MVTFSGALVLEDGKSELELEDKKTALQSEQLTLPATGSTDFIDYIFQFPDQGSWLRDPIIQLYAPSVNGSQPGVQLLIYNPVENLSFAAAAANALVLLPQQANSTVPLPGFWAMLTLQGLPIVQLFSHPNLQIMNDRTLMFARQPSVLLTNIDVSHINIVINIFGVYVTDGLTILSVPTGTLTNDAGTVFLQDDAAMNFLVAG